MQVNFDSNVCKPNFGKLMIKKTALNSISRRIGNCQALREQFEQFSKRMDGLKDVNVTFDTAVNNEHEIMAEIFCAGRYYKSKKEGFWSSVFFNPIKFLEKITKKAEQVQRRINDENNFMAMFESLSERID